MNITFYPCIQLYIFPGSFALEVQTTILIKAIAFVKAIHLTSRKLLINHGPILAALKLIPGSLASLSSYTIILGAFVIFQNQIHIAGKLDDNEVKEIVYYER